MPQIVVIDDEPLVCEVIEAALGDDGADVVCARTSDEGAQILASRPFNLALIDMMMPGRMTAMALAELASNQNTPCLLMSGHPDAREAAVRLGLPYLEKPFSIEALFSESRRVMAQSRENVSIVKEAVAKVKTSETRLSAAITTTLRSVEELRRTIGPSG
jgi:two-component system OmpR family response regulator